MGRFGGDSEIDLNSATRPVVRRCDVLQIHLMRLFSGPVFSAAVPPEWREAVGACSIQRPPIIALPCRVRVGLWTAPAIWTALAVQVYAPYGCFVQGRGESQRRKGIFGNTKLFRWGWWARRFRWLAAHDARHYDAIEGGIFVLAATHRTGLAVTQTTASGLPREQVCEIVEVVVRACRLT